MPMDQYERLVRERIELILQMVFLIGAVILCVLWFSWKLLLVYCLFRLSEQ